MPTALTLAEESWKKKVDAATKSLGRLNWPQIVHSTEFKCDKESIAAIARQLGYAPRPCAMSPDGIWRTKKGELKVHILYEKINPQQ